MFEKAARLVPHFDISRIQDLCGNFGMRDGSRGEAGAPESNTLSNERIQFIEFYSRNIPHNAKYAPGWL